MSAFRPKSAVTVSLVAESKGGPFIFWDNLADACYGAAALHYDAIEIFAPGPDTVTEIELSSLLKSTRLQLAAVGTGAGWVKHKLSLTNSDSEIRKRARDFIRSMIEFGGRHGAPAIIGSMQGRWGEGVSKEEAMNWLREALAELGEYALTYGVPLIYEPLNRYETNLVNNISAGVELMQSLSSCNVRLLADLFHMNIEESNLAEALKAGGQWIGHVHFVDSNRRAAGYGHMNYDLIMKALAEINYAGFLSAESFAWPDSESAAKQTICEYQRLIEPFRAV